MHDRAFGNYILEGIAFLQFLAQIFDCGEIAESLHCAQDITIIITQNRSGYADRYCSSLGIYNTYRLIDCYIAGLHGLLELASGFAYIRVKDLIAFFADRLLLGNAGDLLGRMVEAGYPPLIIDCEDSISNRLQDHLEKFQIF